MCPFYVSPVPVNWWFGAHSADLFLGRGAVRRPVRQQAAIWGQRVGGTQLLVHSFLVLACRVIKVSVSRSCPTGQQAAIRGQRVGGTQLLVHSFLVLACRINKVSVSRSLSHWAAGRHLGPAGRPYSAPRPFLSHASLQNKQGFST
jgi:hypothetical protein